MRKLLFAFIATVAMTFAACGGQTQPTVKAVDSAKIDSIDSILVAADSIMSDSVVAE